MSDTEQLVNRYIEVWNERGPERRAAGLREIWAAQGSYVDPLVSAAGLDQIDAAIDGAQRQFPDFVFRLTGAVEAHHNLVRFSWELGPDGATDAPIAGSDVAVLDEDGRLRDVHGFLDRVPG
ncbi:MAG TPA: nuclear transport factor 2 family protein [Pseudonocardia sp.]|jgi:hypothetical protein|nr:nuclear transport factor 2 family protein [Pseudonocardia sp.]